MWGGFVTVSVPNAFRPFVPSRSPPPISSQYIEWQEFVPFFFPLFFLLIFVCVCVCSPTPAQVLLLFLPPPPPPPPLPPPCAFWLALAWARGFWPCVLVSGVLSASPAIFKPSRRCASILSRLVRRVLSAILLSVFFPTPFSTSTLLRLTPATH